MNELDKDYILGLMVLTMKVLFWLVKGMVRVLIILQMAHHILVTGLMIYSMEKVPYLNLKRGL